MIFSGNLINIINRIFKNIYNTGEYLFADKKLIKKDYLLGNVTKMNNLMTKFYKNEKLVINDVENFERVEFTTEDNVKISGVIYEPNKNSNKWIVAAHWFAGHKFWALYHAKVFADLGYNILAFDFRNHGESDPAPQTLGFLEVRDLIAAIRYLNKTKKPKVLGLMGTSMGGYCVSYVNVAYSDELKKYNLKFVVSDVAYGSFSTLVIHTRNNHARIISRTRIKKIINDIDTTIKKKVPDFDYKKMDIIKKLREGELPAAPQLFIHGKNDNVTSPFDSLEMAFYHSKTYKHDMLTIYNFSTHTQALRQHPKDQITQIIRFEYVISKDKEATQKVLDFYNYTWDDIKNKYVEKDD